MYKFHYDHFWGQWHVFYCHDGKDDFQCAFNTVEEASDFCDEKNLALVNFGGE